MPAELRLRQASASDLPRLLDLYAQLNPEGGPPAGELSGPLDDMLRREGLHLLVAELEGAIVGTVTLLVVPNLTHGGRPWCQVENMVVDESARGAGVGQALLERCRQLAKAHNAYKIQLQSASHRLGAHRFYERYGFRASSAGYRLYLD